MKAEAQFFNGGLVAGVSMASVEMDEANDALAEAIDGKNIIGVEGGIWGRFNLDPLYLKASPMVSYHSGQVDIRYSNGGVQTAGFDDGRFLIPVVLGLRIVGPLRVEGGWVYNWMFHSRNDKLTAVKVRESGNGYRVGANVEFGRINAGLSWQGIKHNSSGNGNTTFRSPDEIILNLAFLLGREQRTVHE